MASSSSSSSSSENHRKVEEVEKLLGPLENLCAWDPNHPSAWCPCIPVPRHVIQIAKREDKTLVIANDEMYRVVELLHSHLTKEKAPKAPFTFLKPFRLIANESECSYTDRIVFYDKKIRNPNVKQTKAEKSKK